MSEPELAGPPTPESEPGFGSPAEARRRDHEPQRLEKIIVDLEEEMLVAAEDLRFEEAGRIRDELKELRRDLEALRA